VHAETPESATLLGMRHAKYVFQPIQELAKDTDFEKRVPTYNLWWMKIRRIMNVLAQHDSTYDSEEGDLQSLNFE